MCYPKPGPRCSSHAAAIYAKAHQAVLDAFYMKNVPAAEVDALIKVREKAEKEYKITPAGILEMERRLAESPDSVYLQEELQKFKNLRKKRLAAVKDREQVKHRVGKQPIVYTPSFFGKDGDEVKKLRYTDPNVEASMEDSRRWSATLTDEEFETVTWYSQAGYGMVNGYLKSTVRKNSSDYEHYVKSKRVQKRIELLDSALAKHTPYDEPVMVYRRQLHYNSEGGLDHTMTLDAIKNRYPVGSVYEPGFYMSTSLDPDNLPSSGFVTALQIRTKTAVPLTSVSSHGPREYEFLIPRDAKFRVVANDVVMKRLNKGEFEEVMVVQLEEL